MAVLVAMVGGVVLVLARMVVRVAIGAAVVAALAALLPVVSPAPYPVEGMLGARNVVTEDRGERRPQGKSRQEPEETAPGAGPRQRLDERIETTTIHPRSTSDEPPAEAMAAPAAAKAVAITERSGASSLSDV